MVQGIEPIGDVVSRAAGHHEGKLYGTGPRWLPLVFGIATVLVYWWVWGALVPAPRHFDETAYLVQARIFAGGHWTAPGRPLPEFFEQFHVLVTPVLAAKYPPGHSLLLSLGELVGFPALIPLLLNGLTGALIYVLAARLAGPLTGVLTWLIWLFAPMDLIFRPSFLSNVTTGALWVIGWWALLKWWEGGERRWLLLLAGCAGWCIITRPLTGLVFVLPVAVVVVRRVRQRGLWRDLGFALALGTMVLAILPLANQRTTGHWLEMAWTAYARQYMPYDRLGFGFDYTPPLRAPDAEMRKYTEIFRPIRRSHTLAALPGIAANRLRWIIASIWAPVLLPLALVGAIAIPRLGLLGLVSAGLLVLAHLAYPHPPNWTTYYLEAVPAVAFATAVGITTLGKFRGDRSLKYRRARMALAAYAWIAFAIWLYGAARLMPWARERQAMALGPYGTFPEQLRQLPAAKAIVFVRYGPYHRVYQSLIMNEPDLASARIWVVHDRGPDNTRLLALAPDRVAYLYDDEREKLVALDSAQSVPVKATGP